MFYFCLCGLIEKCATDLFTVFFQLVTWTRYGKTVDATKKSARKISKIAEFESVLLKTNEGIASQSREI